ncbi:MAG TPA: hypothetical protein VMM60_09255, partial [Ilumatobacter sp.]|nr:hypothetical protein [Ilumatobacter sp.]
MDVHGIDQPWLQLDLIHQVLDDDDQWTPAPPGSALPDQLPIGVAWLDELPRVLSWLHSTPDAVEQVELMGRRRAQQLFE